MNARVYLFFKRAYILSTKTLGTYFLYNYIDSFVHQGGIDAVKWLYRCHSYAIKNKQYCNTEKAYKACIGAEEHMTSQSALC